MYLQIPNRIIEVVGELPLIEVMEKIADNISDNSFTDNVDAIPEIASTIESIPQLIPNKGYVIGDSVYVYTESLKNNPDVEVPMVYLQKTKDRWDAQLRAAKTNPMELFSVQNLISMDAASISNSLVEGEKLYDEEAINDMNMASSVFVPEINETDDFLKKVIKQTIIDKKIDINRLKSHMTKSYGLSNMKQALVMSTRMSTTNFITWAELLGIDFTVTVTDNGRDTINPLKHPLTYDSYSDKVTEIKE